MHKVALLLPGQGSQYVGMCKKFYDSFSIAKEVFQEANDVLSFDLKKLCFEGDIQELTKTENTQPAILTVSVAMFKIFMKETGIKPSFLAGHSLGELSALTCAGAIDFDDAVKIVRQRGVFMQEAAAVGIGAMSAISGISSDVINQECIDFSNENVVVISNYNSPEQTVISGHKEAVFKVGEKLKEMGGKVIPLKVSAPFHSPLMQPAAKKFSLELQRYTFNELKYPVISNETALPYEGKDSIVGNLSEHLVKPVRWRESMEYLNTKGVESIVEIGPQTVLRNLMKSNVPSIKAFSLDDEDDYRKLNEILSSKDKTQSLGNKIKMTVITRCLAIAVCVPNKNLDNDGYQKGVIEPYRKIQKMQEEIESQDKEPTKEQMFKALEMLRSVFITKKTPLEEQIERFEQIFLETGTKDLLADFEMPV